MLTLDCEITNTNRFRRFISDKISVPRIYDTKFLLQSDISYSVAKENRTCLLSLTSGYGQKCSATPRKIRTCPKALEAADRRVFLY